MRETCLWLPEAEEFLAHGSPNFRVRGKTFATYALNHHGDGRVALWLNAPPGSQEMHVRAEPRHFFVPAYVGHRGWLGVALDKGISWTRVVALVREAFEKTAPQHLCASLGKTPTIEAPDKALAAEQIDPFKSARALARYQGDALTLIFWVGVEAQGMFTADARFSIPPCMGHNGWIALDVTRDCDWQEAAALCEQSYRHFALKRMLASMASSKAPITPD